MPEATEPGATPAAPGATPAPDTTTPPAAKPDGEPLGSAGLAALQREREARETAQKERDALAAKVKAYEDKDKSESEKNTERIAELEKELATERSARQTGAVQIATIASARKLGFRDPDLAYRLIQSDVEFDDSGAPKNVEKLLEGIAKASPYLLTTGRPNGADNGLGPRGGPAPSGNDDMNSLIRRAAGRA